MKKEDSLQTSPFDIMRSMTSYIFGRKSKIDGSVSALETSSGQKLALYKPPGYETNSDKYPVLYHLHGAAMPWNWVFKELTWLGATLEQAIKNGKAKPMLIVSPHDPSKFSMWSDSDNGSNNVASAIQNDLIPFVETNFNVVGTRETRFLQGFSMGGFGAATHAFKYQNLFAAVVIWDGALHTWDTLNANRPSIAKNQFSNVETAFNDWSPWIAAQNADLTKTPVMIISGLLVGFADKYTEFLLELDANVTRYDEDCLHNLKCLLSKRGETVFEFYTSFHCSLVR